MSTAKHTPGPWVVQEYSDGFGVSAIADDDLEAICTMIVPINGDEESNARLIAAAPELLEALELALSFDKPDYKGGWEQKARAAIAKAKGGAA